MNILLACYPSKVNKAHTSCDKPVQWKICDAMILYLSVTLIPKWHWNWKANKLGTSLFSGSALLQHCTKPNPLSSRNCWEAKASGGLIPFLYCCTPLQSISSLLGTLFAGNNTYNVLVQLVLEAIRLGNVGMVKDTDIDTDIDTENGAYCHNIGLCLCGYRYNYR